MRSKSFLAAVFVAAFTLSAAAQNAPTRIRGTVEKLDGQTLMVKSRDGQSLSITLAPDVEIITLVKKSRAADPKLARLKERWAQPLDSPSAPYATVSPFARCSTA